MSDRQLSPEQRVEETDERDERAAAQPECEDDQQRRTWSPAPAPEAAKDLAEEAGGHEASLGETLAPLNVTNDASTREYSAGVMKSRTLPTLHGFDVSRR